METVEYSACVDCYYFAEYGNCGDDAPAELDSEIGAAFERVIKRDNLTGFCTGDELSEFSRYRCEICERPLAGSRHQVFGYVKRGEA
jgi:hypothetical protein